MARTTLPDFDPLAQLGIRLSSTERSGQQPNLTHRRDRQRVAPKPTAAPLTSSDAALPASTSVEPTPAAGGQSEAPQETPLSGPVEAVAALLPAERFKPRLSLAASSPAAARVLKAKTSGRVPSDLWEEVRDCVVFHGHMMTIDSFTKDAFREHLRRLRKQRGLGDRFPVRERDPKHGRRVS